MNAANGIIDQARKDIGAIPMLKFKKGDYFLDKEPVMLGSTYLVYCQDWVKAWVHFVDSVPVEKRLYRPAKYETPPERDEIPDNDQSLWEKFGPDGKPKDPWVLQYLVPFEDLQSGSVSVFVGQTFGSQRAVSEVCNAWGTRVKRTHEVGNPIVELRVSSFNSKTWGKVIRPYFPIVKYDDPRDSVQANGDDGLPAIEVEKLALKDDMSDDIPF